jgi:hypothetical protein
VHAAAENMVKQGSMVLSVDLRGLGETRAPDERNGSDWPRYFGDFYSSMTSFLTGKPLVAMRAEDITRGVDLLIERGASQVSVHGVESAAIPALYAAAFDKRVVRLVADRMLVSYDSVVRHRIHRGAWENAVHGALRYYDLPDLARWMGSRGLRLIDAVDPLGQLLDLAPVRAAYPMAQIERRKPEL